MKNALIVIVAILSAALSGCDKTEKPTMDTVAIVGTQLTYFKDTYGICYASIGSRTYGGLLALSITTVPCNQVKL